MILPIGLLHRLMAGYVRWLAPRYQETAAKMREQAAKLRAELATLSEHRRINENIAELLAGFELFLQFAQEVKAVGDEQARDLRKQALQAFGRLAGAQAEHQVGADPAERFIELVRAAFSSGRAHVADPDGNRPRDSQVWGWRDWEEPEGERIGWVDGSDVYLEPQASFAAVQRLARDAGEPLAISAQTLRRYLKDKGLLLVLTRPEDAHGPANPWRGATERAPYGARDLLSRRGWSVLVARVSLSRNCSFRNSISHCRPQSEQSLTSCFSHMRQLLLKLPPAVRYTSAARFHCSVTGRLVAIVDTKNRLIAVLFEMDNAWTLIAAAVLACL